MVYLGASAHGGMGQSMERWVLTLEDSVLGWSALIPWPVER